MTRHRPTSDKRKALGQNFLRGGPAVSAPVAAAAIGPDELVVEIGAGGGAPTREPPAPGCRPLVGERDPQYAASLRQTFAEPPRVTVAEVDVRELRWPDEPFRVLANIPFGLTTEILRLLLD